MRFSTKLNMSGHQIVTHLTLKQLEYFYLAQGQILVTQNMTFHWWLNNQPHFLHICGEQSITYVSCTQGIQFLTQVGSCEIGYRIVGNFRRSKFSQKFRFPSRRNFRGFNFRVQRKLLTYRPQANRGRKVSHGKGQDVVRQFEIALQCHRQTSDRARLAHKTYGVKISKSSRVQIFAVLYFAVLIFAQSQIEIEYYSIAYFECITEFDALQR